LSVISFLFHTTAAVYNTDTLPPPITVVPLSDLFSLQTQTQKNADLKPQNYNNIVADVREKDDDGEKNDEGCGRIEVEELFVMD